MQHNAKAKQARLAARTLFALAATTLLSVSCSTTTGSSTSENSGSITVNVPSVAPWIVSLRDGSASSSKSKAIAYLSKLKISVLNSNSEAVASGTITLSTSNSYSSASSTIPLIPAGSYTVQVDGYNSAVSATAPVVSGKATGVTITKGENTAVAISCIPKTPIAISLDTATSLSLASGAEQWYSFAVTKGQSYYLTQTNGEFALCLNDESGAQISYATSYIAYTATYSGTAYFVVAAVDSDASSASTSVTVSTTQPSLSEGSSGSPVSLSLNTAHSFRIPVSSSASYYSFTASTAGKYCVELSCDAYVLGYLYSDSSYSTYVSGANGAGEVLFSGLTAGTTYYLKLYKYSSPLITDGQIMDPSAIAAASSNEGSTTPVSLTLGTAHSGQVGYHDYDMRSYYSFTTGSGVDYSLTMSGLSSSVSVTASSSSQTFDQFSISSSTRSLVLSPNTTCYVTVFNGNGSALNYSLTVSAVDAPTFTSLTAGGGWASGTLTDTNGASWYMASVSAGGSYTLKWDSATSGSGSYTAYPSVSAYESDRSTSYFKSAYSGGYATGKTITIPSDQTTLYIRVYDTTGSFALSLTKN